MSDETPDLTALAEALHATGLLNLPLADSLDVDCFDAASAVLAAGFGPVRAVEAERDRALKDGTSVTDREVAFALNVIADLRALRTPEDVEALTDALYADDDLGPGYMMRDDCEHLARRFLASDWLAAREAASATRARAEALREVWHVSAHGRSVDRVCDSLATGKSVCDDLMNLLGGPWTVVEDWANLNVPEAPERWVRYVQRGDSARVEQAVAAIRVDTSGTWFRENTPAYRDSLTPETPARTIPTTATVRANLAATTTADNKARWNRALKGGA